MLDSFIEENELIIVFEWALGGDLKRVIRRQIEQRTLMDESLIWGHFSQVSNKAQLARNAQTRMCNRNNHAFPYVVFKDTA